MQIIPLNLDPVLLLLPNSKLAYSFVPGVGNLNFSESIADKRTTNPLQSEEKKESTYFKFQGEQ